MFTYTESKSFITTASWPFQGILTRAVLSHGVRTHTCLLTDKVQFSCTRFFPADDFLAPFRLSDKNQTPIQDEDDDVAAERRRIYDGGSKTDILQLRDLSKVKTTFFHHGFLCLVCDFIMVSQFHILLYTAVDFVCNISSLISSWPFYNVI